MNAVRMLLALLSTVAYAKDDLKDRLECIPNGNRRFRMAYGQLKAVCDDLIGTISRAQAKQIYGTIKDYELRLAPKATPGTVNVILTKEQGMDLMDMARERCLDCVLDGNECRECKLYQMLESTTPMDDYGSGLTCPYATAEWR
jgi:hypothetical protein